MKPKLRPLGIRPIVHQGQEMLLLGDPLCLSEASIAVPRQMAPLLALMDGTRDQSLLEAALSVRAGIRLAPGLLERLMTDLDRACLLDNERYVSARAEALLHYRDAPFRPMTTAGSGIPTDPDAASAHLATFSDGAPLPGLPCDPLAICGVVSPHIDYQRGGGVYATVWRAAAEAARRADLVLLLGTDHQGSDGSLTLTRQSYATPWGVLPTETPVVQSLVDALGEDVAFAEELNHRREHSIELAAVWLHHVRGGRPVPVVPILCGGFESFVTGDADPCRHEPFVQALEILHQVRAARRTLVVAAADLAHIGPAFGDARAVDLIARAQLRNSDQRLLDRVCAGDSAGFLAELRASGNRQNVCGLPPIFLMLNLLPGVQGSLVSYAQCPADPFDTSLVSIAGLVLY